MPSEWNLHYARWVIDDGEPDRNVDESFEWFALEFWTEGPIVVTEGTTERTASPVGDYQYRVTAKVEYVSEKAVVIDGVTEADVS